MPPFCYTILPSGSCLSAGRTWMISILSGKKTCASLLKKLFSLLDRWLLDLRQGLLLLVYQTFKYSDEITCMCRTYHLRSHLNQKPKMQITKGSKLGCPLR